MTLRDLLEMCALDAGVTPRRDAVVWLFPRPTAMPTTAQVRGPHAISLSSMRTWGQTLTRAVAQIARQLMFVPTAIVVLLPDPAGAVIQGASVSDPPAQIISWHPGTTPIIMPLPADESVATVLLEYARRTAAARFN